jgi:hypothetical protein
MLGLLKRMAKRGIHTERILRTVHYVNLVSRIQQHPNMLLDPFILLATERLCGASRRTLKMMRKERTA